MDFRLNRERNPVGKGSKNLSIDIYPPFKWIHLILIQRFITRIHCLNSNQLYNFCRVKKGSFRDSYGNKNTNCVWKHCLSKQLQPLGMEPTLLLMQVTLLRILTPGRMWMAENTCTWLGSSLGSTVLGAQDSSLHHQKTQQILLTCMTAWSIMWLTH